LKGNILGANQHLRANYENFNLGHQINIQGEGRRGWEAGPVLSLLGPGAKLKLGALLIIAIPIPLNIQNTLNFLC